MTRLVAIHRHPIKGFTAEALDHAGLVAGEGLPLDRQFAFVSGRKEDQPVAGGWVQSRTFLMLTLFPELARFSCKLTDNDRSLAVTDPDGQTAMATVRQPGTFTDANALIREHFDDGPHGPPRLVEQTPGYGHWDFSDTALSIINLATVRVISEAVGRPLEKERFRGNIYIDGLDPWEEFSWPGCRLQIGEAQLDVLRPAQRCAMTSTEPGTGIRDIDVPATMTESFGHMFCGMYARVTAAGRIAANDDVNVSARGVFNPNDNLPVRAADPSLWPRYLTVLDADDKTVRVTTSEDNWPLLPALLGQNLRIHSHIPQTGHTRSQIVTYDPTGYRLGISGLHGVGAGQTILVSGPVGHRPA
ncbi:MAG: MOSC domain-containing protein [Hyphomicrobiaceae bacterium]